MASKVKPSTALFFFLNLFFFALVSSYNVDNNTMFPNDGSAQSYYGTCNPLSLGVCVNLLGGLVNLDLGNVPTQPCCSLIHGLADLEAAVCLCTAVRANVLDIKLNLPISLSLLLDNCGRRVATEYICAP
ncbi:hypothetical protein ES332_D10G241400v1 [Gossypium tomentosum]|uniref:Hydrophobic seed protein domain-containing protein n=1 Tax=Gossypium tomentosum TaxID=34277 RepID=A0A5D2J918_GOSTO|nr:hypothetical protein ES332_D10G241400v1 [Gossypium tomentosum]